MVLFTGGILIYGTLDMPPFGDPSDPIHHHVAPYYLEHSEEDTGVPNVVTSVLASYRGYDTMGETTVVFTAAVGVMILLSGMRRKEPYGQEAWGEDRVDHLDIGFVEGFGQRKSGAAPTKKSTGKKRKRGKGRET